MKLCFIKMVSCHHSIKLRPFLAVILIHNTYNHVDHVDHGSKNTWLSFRHYFSKIPVIISLQTRSKIFESLNMYAHSTGWPKLIPVFFFDPVVYSTSADRSITYLYYWLGAYLFCVPVESLIIASLGSEW